RLDRDSRARGLRLRQYPRGKAELHVGDLRHHHPVRPARCRGVSPPARQAVLTHPDREYDPLIGEQAVRASRRPLRRPDDGAAAPVNLLDFACLSPYNLPRLEPDPLRTRLQFLSLPLTLTALLLLFGGCSAIGDLFKQKPQALMPAGDLYAQGEM